jgi:hypothetical protein
LCNQIKRFFGCHSRLQSSNIGFLDGWAIGNGVGKGDTQLENVCSRINSCFNQLQTGFLIRVAKYKEGNQCRPV